MFVGEIPRAPCIRYVGTYSRVNMLVNSYPGVEYPLRGPGLQRAKPQSPRGSRRLSGTRGHRGQSPEPIRRQQASHMTRARTSQTENTEECVEKYQNHFSWLRDSKFLQDLENDSVDSEIIEEELSALQEEEVTITKRKKVVKFLQSNPVQVLLCVVVLLDAVIVIAQILLDLNSVKNKLHIREEQLGRFLNIVRMKWPEELHQYEGHDFEHILQILEDHLCDNMTEQQKLMLLSKSAKNTNHTSSSSAPPSPHGSSSQRIRRQGEPPASGPSGYVSDTSHDTSHLMTSPEGKRSAAQSARSASSNSRLKNRSNPVDNMQDKNSEDAASNTHDSHGTDIDCTNLYHKHGSQNIIPLSHVVEEEHDVLHEVAHGLHFASVAILGFLVLVDLVKIVAMGTYFFKHKIEIFDAIIIVMSFVFDLIFLGGVTGEEGQKAAAVLIILLLWRIARVVDGILVTVKQRQEFRIRLQKRSRRTAERKIDMLEEERHLRMRQIQCLKELCCKAGVREDEIESCTPRRGPRRVSTTMCALSSVARLSVSMTMSMSSGLFSLIDDEVCGDESHGQGRDRRLSSNSKTREYLGPCDNSDNSPKSVKKKINNCIGHLPLSPKPGSSTDQDGIWLPKLAESSLESSPDHCGTSSNCYPRSPLRKKKKSDSDNSPRKVFSRKDKKLQRQEEVAIEMHDQSHRSPSHHHKNKHPRIGSPENSSGVQIVIDEGSEVNSCCSIEAEESTSAFDSDSYLTVESAYDADRRTSTTSQILLLGESP